MAEATHKTRQLESLPVHEFRRFRCPSCKGDKFKMKSKRDSDGMSTQYRTCKACGYHFVLFVI